MPIVFALPKLSIMLLWKQKVRDEVNVDTASAYIDIVDKYRSMAVEAQQAITGWGVKNETIEYVMAHISKNHSDAINIAQCFLRKVGACTRKHLSEVRTLSETSWKLKGAIEGSADLDGKILLPMSKSADAKKARASYQKARSYKKAFDAVTAKCVANFASDPNKDFQALSEQIVMTFEQEWRLVHELVASCLIIQAIWGHGDNDQLAAVGKAIPILDSVLEEGGMQRVRQVRPRLGASAGQDHGCRGRVGRAR